MPPVAKRDCGVILYDINASNKDDSLAALIKILTFNWLSKNKNTYRVILTNTKESNKKRYKNVYDTGISDTDPQPILNSIENMETEKGNWLHPLLLAIDHLKEAYELPDDMEMSKVEQIINDLREYNIYLYIIGPEIKLPRPIMENSDVEEVMRDIILDESNPALTLAKRIVDATTYSVLCDLKVGVNLFFAYRNPRGTQPWKVPLSFGSRLEIPACTVKIYKMEAPFKLSKRNYSLKYILAEDEEVEVDFSELVSGIERHGKFVKIEDNAMFRIEGPRNFSVIGFTDRKNVPEYFMRDSTFCVLPDADKPNDCSQALYNLVDILAEEKKYAIMRRVYNANNKPKYFVLVPQPDLEPKCFIMAEIPYADDLKQPIKFVEPLPQQEVEVDDVFKEFFDSIDISEEKCRVNVQLGPKMLLNETCSKLANVSANKYLNREFSFADIDINAFEDNENEYLETLRDSWPEASEQMDESTSENN